MTYRGLILDFGGVVTTDLYAEMSAFCVREGLPPDAAAVRRLLCQQAGERVVDVAAFPQAGRQFGRVIRISGEQVQSAIVPGEDQVGAVGGDLS